MEVLGIVDALCIFNQDDGVFEKKLIARRQALRAAYDALPAYASPAFWSTIDSREIPLEVVVRLLRKAIEDGDEQARSRFMAVILHRIQGMNEYWARSALQKLPLHNGERNGLIGDLCADLHECILRAIIDLKRPFWEENFLHCLRFERRHVHRSFMIREGWWRSVYTKQETRIPRACVASLDQLVHTVDGIPCAFDIEDERAHTMFLMVEYSDILRCVMGLPESLKSVVLLMFWEGRSEKEIARLLRVSDRTVRNRLQHALNALRNALARE